MVLTDQLVQICERPHHRRDGDEAEGVAEVAVPGVAGVVHLLVVVLVGKAKQQLLLVGSRVSLPRV